jgi:hypothetical protein
LIRARAAYQQFVLQAADIDDGDLDQESHPDDPRILGADSFINNIPFVPYRPRSPLTLEQFVESICAQHSISPELLRSPSRARHLVPIRILLTTQAIEQRIATLCDVARYLHRDPSSLTKLLARHETRQRLNDQ